MKKILIILLIIINLILPMSVMAFDYTVDEETGIKLYELPNGVKDEIVDVKLIKRVSNEVITSSNFVISGISGIDWQVPNMTSFYFSLEQMSLTNIYQDDNGIAYVSSPPFEYSRWCLIPLLGKLLLLDHLRMGCIRVSDEKTGILLSDTDEVKIYASIVD